MTTGALLFVTDVILGLQFYGLPDFSADRGLSVLAIQPSEPEFTLAGGQLRFLRLVGRSLSVSHRVVNVRRFLCRTGDPRRKDRSF